MTTQSITDRIGDDPEFRSFVASRNRYSIIMTTLMMIVYFGYILLIAFDKQFLATKIAAGSVTSIGIPLGLGVLVFTIVLTAIFVHRANTQFDARKEAIIRRASK